MIRGSVLLAAGGFATHPAVNARVFGTLGPTRPLGGALDIAAFNVDVTLAPYISGLVIDHGRAWQPSATWVRPSRSPRSRPLCGTAA
ncbi:hypothetical protein [Streptomyces sp. NPDC003247]|uniref:hypothetical protein n=1 Tax=Streptomyces sp. NPDC003247 TaxID=3364677 RepID=UPI0036CCBC62